MLTLIILAYGWFPEAWWHSSMIISRIMPIVRNPLLNAFNKIWGVITRTYKMGPISLYDQKSKKHKSWPQYKQSTKLKAVLGEAMPCHHILQCCFFFSFWKANFSLFSFAQRNKEENWREKNQGKQKYGVEQQIHIKNSTQECFAKNTGLWGQTHILFVDFLLPTTHIPLINTFGTIVLPYLKLSVQFHILILLVSTVHRKADYFKNQQQHRNCTKHSPTNEGRKKNTSISFHNNIARVKKATWLTRATVGAKKTINFLVLISFISWPISLISIKAIIVFPAPVSSKAIVFLLRATSNTFTW